MADDPTRPSSEKIFNANKVTANKNDKNEQSFPCHFNSKIPFTSGPSKEIGKSPKTLDRM